MLPEPAVAEPPRLPRRRRFPTRALLGGCLCFALGVGAGFLFFTRALPAWLAAEMRPALEAALGGPVSLGSLRPAFRFGLAFAAENVQAWPGPTGPALRIERAQARLSSVDLTRGRLRIHAVELDGLRLELERGKDGRLAPEALDRRLRETSPSDGGVSWDLPERVDLRDAEVVLLDVAQMTSWRARVSRLSLASQRGGGIALDGRADLERARGVDAPATPVGSIEVSAFLVRDGTSSATLSARALDLAALPEGALPRAATGHVSGVAKLALDARSGSGRGENLVEAFKRGRGELELALQGERIRVPLDTEPGDPGEARALSAGAARLRGRLSLAPRGFTLHDATLETDGLALSAHGALTRPVSSRASLALALAAPELTPEVARRLAGMLPRGLRERATALLARVGGGALHRLSARGAAPLARWQALLAGERGAWTRGFSEPPSVSFEANDLTLRLDDAHRLEGLRGSASWHGDTLQIRQLAGRFDGDPTDELDLHLEGVSALLDARDPDAGATSSSEALAGRRPIVRLLSQPPGAINPGWSELALEIDHLAHALLVWPLVEAKALARPRTGGFHVTLERGRWGGVPVHGEADLFDGPPDRIHVTLVAGGEAPPAAVAGAPASESSSWARGRYRLALVPRGDVPVRNAQGFFRASGARLRLFESELALAPGGRLRGEAELDLSRPDVVPYHVRFVLDQASAADFMALLGDSAPEARGSVEAAGELSGQLAPGRSILAGATGSGRVEAREGELPTRLPLFLYLASASAALNPFASRDRIAYRKIKGDLALADDRVSTRNLTLHGPDLRIGASGSLGVLPPHEVQSVIGIALRGNVSRTIGAIPLVGYLVLGRDKSLVSLWFHLDGPWRSARATPIPIKSLAVGPAGIVTEGMPKLFERGIDALADLLGRDDDAEAGDGEAWGAPPSSVPPAASPRP